MDRGAPQPTMIIIPIARKARPFEKTLEKALQETTNLLVDCEMIRGSTLKKILPFINH